MLYLVKIMPKKPVITVVAGGQSSEHEISLLSARFVFENIDRSRFKPYFLGIDKKGRFRLYEDGQKLLWHADNPEKVKLAPGYKPVAFLPAGEGRLVFLDDLTKKFKIDLFFPVLHGAKGEDGVIQGMFEMVGAKYVGCGVLASAVGMDKAAVKMIWLRHGLPVGKFLVATLESVPDFAQVKEKLGLPVFVKPANAGSSVGVSKAKDKKEYLASLKQAFEHDQKVLIEAEIKGREIEVAVVGKGKGAYASTPGEVITLSDEFYSYKAKYLDENGAEMKIPAPLDSKTKQSFKKIALEAFLAIGAKDISRVDFFLTKDGQIYLNEINTMPGFTARSMYPKLLEHDGVSATKLITRLINLNLG